MSRNRESEDARRYHDQTAHSPQSVRLSGHRLDWDNKPAPFKLYPDLPAVALPRELPDLRLDTLTALSGPPGAPRPLDLDRLAALLFFSAGVTKVKRYPGGGEVYFRAAPSTGALYQTEVYVVAGDVPGLEAGIYHFCPGDFTLRRLRAGDFRGALARAAADDTVAAQPAALVLTAIYWRNTWKYQARGYRHLFWDSGTMLAHALASATAAGVPARLVTGFVEREVNALLGVDAAREGALVAVPLGPEGRSAPPPPPVSPLDARFIPLSDSEVDYPLLRQAYEDSSLDSEAEVWDWREAAQAAPGGTAPTGALIALPAPAMTAGRPLGDTIQARGSTREFSGAPISAQALATALYHATRDFPSDAPTGLVDLYLTAHAVDGLEPGAYAYHPAAQGLEAITRGDFRARSAFLCLDQPLGGMSSATVFFLSDLGRVLGPLGNRGYRLANLEAGLRGGRLYLAAYAQRFGASGLTFYDREVVEFFSPHAAGKDALFVTALGRAVREPSRSPATVGIRST
ncbi:MAG TPA: SagB/ThcOx family dehydrogenase [Methylomirabilota bacterium]|nr:SagB/ThcOx family dehydrogenase [Methylomirabilota bacterium]